MLVEEDVGEGGERRTRRKMKIKKTMKWNPRQVFYLHRL